MTGAERIAKERRRQIEKEGWTLDHDEQHGYSELIMAAICYTLEAVDDLDIRLEAPCDLRRELWPWTESDWKPSNPVRNLEKAGALIAAEIDRIAWMAKGGKE